MAISYALRTPTLFRTEKRANPMLDYSMDYANFALTNSTKEGNTSTATYTYGVGSARDLTTFTVRKSYNNKTNMTNCSVRASAFIKKSDSVSGEEEYIPVESVIAWNYQGEMVPDHGCMVDLVSMAVNTVLYPWSAVNDTPDGRAVAQLDLGILSLLFA